MLLPAAHSAPAYTLQEALRRFGAEPLAGPGRALDLGCGRGPDTLALLARGWHVTAVDRNPAAVAAAQQAAHAAGYRRLTAVVAEFEMLALPTCDLVNATFALPFCAPPQFPALWRRLTAALRPGGRFAGQFFGPRDSWATDARLTILSVAQVRALLEADFNIEVLEEQEKGGRAYDGQLKHWHVLHVVARRRPK